MQSVQVFQSSFRRYINGLHIQQGSNRLQFWLIYRKQKKFKSYSKWPAYGIPGFGLLNFLLTSMLLVNLFSCLQIISAFFLSYGSCSVVLYIVIFWSQTHHVAYLLCNYPVHLVYPWCLFFFFCPLALENLNFCPYPLFQLAFISIACFSYIILDSMSIRFLNGCCPLLNLNAVSVQNVKQLLSLNGQYSKKYFYYCKIIFLEFVE